MFKKIKLQHVILFFIVTTSGVCHPKRDEAKVSGNGKSDYFLVDNSDTDFKGVRTKDESLQAITIPCHDNNTFRLYYSDSAARTGLPDSLTVVSYGRRLHLGYRECCIEVTSSIGETWLSTGNSKLKLGAGTGTISAGSNAMIWLQLFTSTPQSDSTTVVFDLVPE